MPTSIPVYITRSQKFSSLVVLIIVLALPIGLSLYGWYSGDREKWLLLTAFGVFVGGGTLLATRKMFRFGNAPIFAITDAGIEIPPNKVFRWRVFKEAVVFKFQGDKMIGLRPQDDLSLSEQMDVEAAIKDGLLSAMLDLPLVILFSGVTPSGEEILTEFRNHGLPVVVIEKEIKFGEDRQRKSAKADE